MVDRVPAQLRHVGTSPHGRGFSYLYGDMNGRWLVWHRETGEVMAATRTREEARARCARLQEAEKAAYDR